MVRILVREPQLDDIHYVEMTGLSTDNKPTGFATGSIFIEVDTGKSYFYDEAGVQWIEAGGNNG